eukprot:3941653-Rhodomonas_salina.1
MRSLAFDFAIKDHTRYCAAASTGFYAATSTWHSKTARNLELRLGASWQYVSTGHRITRANQVHAAACQVVQIKCNPGTKHALDLYEEAECVLPRRSMECGGDEASLPTGT